MVGCGIQKTLSTNCSHTFTNPPESQNLYPINSGLIEEEYAEIFLGTSTYSSEYLAS
jgi:hypothetical protein